MDPQLKQLVESRITAMGIKKKYLAERMGLDSVRLSQTLSGKRKIQPNELKELKLTLSIA